MIAKDVPRNLINARLLGAFYALEAGALSLLIGLHKYSDQLGSAGVRPLAWLLGSLIVVLTASVYITGAFRRHGGTGTRPFYLALAMNLVVVVALLATGEAAVRMFSVQTPQGLSFAGTRLLPRSWEDVKARNRALLRSAPPNSAYFVEDTLLGWSVGPNRSSSDGLYLSSAEGIRSPRQGMAYADDPARTRVAAIGDSYTFGLNGRYEDSWGARLQQQLGPDTVVLNFGVDGYGVDQAYLRYLRDARPWHPAVAIFGFIQHDLVRTLSVYTFLTFPTWGYPFSKPRFSLRAGQPELLNVPLIRADSVLSKPEVTDLPFLQYEPGYDSAEWTDHFYFSSYLVRYLLSRFPRYPVVPAAVSSDVLQQINAHLLLKFTRVATAEGSIPIVAYYPSRNDFSAQGDFSARDSVFAALRRSGVAYLDLTPCVQAVGVDRAFIPGMHHYSAAGNAAVAQCLLPVVREALERRARSPRARTPAGQATAGPP